MKVFLCRDFNSTFYHVNARLHRDLESLYYLMGIDVTTNEEQHFDFAHFVDISQKSKILYVKERLKKKVILNYFVNKKNSNSLENSYLIPFEDKRILNKVDLIIVSCQADKMTLILNDIKTNIEIMTPSVKEERFTKINELEKNSFFQYAGLLKNEEFALAVVNYKNYQDIFDLISLSEKLPELSFFVFGPKIKFSTPRKIKKMIKNAPRNIKFKTIINEDLFKSAMLLSKFYIVTRESEGEVITILEAMITKTQLLTFNTHLNGDVLKDNVNCILSNDIDQMKENIVNYLNGKISTIDEAYKYAKECNYLNSSQNLKNILDQYIDFSQKNN